MRTRAHPSHRSRSCDGADEMMRVGSGLRVFRRDVDANYPGRRHLRRRQRRIDRDWSRCARPHCVEGSPGPNPVRTA
jgi:hypothetical protein